MIPCCHEPPERAAMSERAWFIDVADALTWPSRDPSWRCPRRTRRSDTSRVNADLMVACGERESPRDDAFGLIGPRMQELARHLLTTGEVVFTTGIGSSAVVHPARAWRRSPDVFGK